MMSYDNSIFNISAKMFSILVLQEFRSRFGGNYHVKIFNEWQYLRYSVASID